MALLFLTFAPTVALICIEALRVIADRHLVAAAGAEEAEEAKEAEGAEGVEGAEGAEETVGSRKSSDSTRKRSVVSAHSKGSARHFSLMMGDINLKALLDNTLTMFADKEFRKESVAAEHDSYHDHRRHTRDSHTRQSHTRQSSYKSSHRDHGPYVGSRMSTLRENINQPATGKSAWDDGPLGSRRMLHTPRAVCDAPVPPARACPHAGGNPEERPDIASLASSAPASSLCA